MAQLAKDRLPDAGDLGLGSNPRLGGLRVGPFQASGGTSTWQPSVSGPQSITHGIPSRPFPNPTPKRTNQRRIERGDGTVGSPRRAQHSQRELRELEVLSSIRAFRARAPGYC
jgi:hypothetical protein